MITFEECQFKVNHSQIGNINEGKRLEEVKAGDWFYIITPNYFSYCETVMAYPSYPKTRFRYKYKTAFASIEVEFEKTIDGGCTYVDYFNNCVTTLYDVAEEWHQKLCPNKELEEFPKN